NALKKFDKKVQNRLINLDPVLGRFYGLPKIHKREIPFRPIISNNDTATEHISSLVDMALKSLPSKFPSYIKNTNDFLDKIHNLRLPNKDCFLVTLDVGSLYSNIPHSDCIMSLEL